LEVNGRSVAVRVSVGVIEVSAASRDADQIVADADIALYVAKAKGGGRYEEFKPGMRVEAEHRARMRGELQLALDLDLIEVHYQPVFELAGLRPVGFEAFLRWRHPQRGLLKPAQFLRLIEAMGLGVEIGGRVIHKVFEQIHRWQQEDRWQPGWYVSINLFRQQLVDLRVVGQIDEAFARWPIDRASIRIELAEALLSTHYALAVKALRQLRGCEVVAAVDDFGTGVSGLAVRRDLDVDTIKIDALLIEGIANVSRSQDLVRGILALGQEFGCRVVAEGIETREQQVTLSALKCEYGQGFLLAEPMSAPRLVEWFALWQASIPSIFTPDGSLKVH
jgi:EAL domain-containing protein (putative c-di-GMP-specific phosphodiesterase class I)